jgi:hypothetical protein
MNGKDFIRRAKKLGKVKGVVVLADKAHGKGSHQTLFLLRIGPDDRKARRNRERVAPRHAEAARDRPE